MEYNTERPKMIIPEYGRNVQNMVAFLKTIEDPDRRNKNAKALIDVMGNLNPHLRDVPDFKHKLWDHLFIMSDFDLDVDSPYPIPEAEKFVERPATVPYTQSKIRYRYYGKMVELMIAEGIKMENSERKDMLKIAIANQMKKCYLLWNKDTVDDSTILKHLNELSEGLLSLAEGTTLTTSFNYQSQKGGAKKPVHKNNHKKKPRR
ncbi:MAG: hypothetical protein ACI8ZO_000580 [Flavobacteriales bacterium]|jgi:hypothetical protein